MTLFYDPVKKRPHTWVMACFIIIPIIVIMLFILVGKHIAKNKPAEGVEKKADIFERI